MKSMIIAMLLIASLSDVWATQRSVILSVPGMNCAACPITIKKALEKVEGITAVTIDLERKQATVTFDDTRTATAKLIQATIDAGYPSNLLESRQ
ncbi:mercury resistance system periplasmic binding protein MerP [Methylococcus sp. EFPC2]|uniref:mercury resistance system periplasmic binding protein MerP n=1 Tax=Methylococcus sp. EFPC2 TaxID=2812648 RepID=UPI0019684BBF|nr:mercury resistance system periplasmic binding protein MerP [Methylococcus sp. EFPC2]QSA98107.1 mercury resistance system periplasmic binding protein MerP [Methylococcus sp. EFPC2]